MAIASSVSVSVPIWLTLMRIELPTPASIPRCRRLVLVTNRSSPTSWTLVAECVGQRLPAVPVLLVHPVLDRHDRVAAGELGPVGGELGGAQHAALVLEVVGAVVLQLAGRRVHRDRDVVAGRVAGRLDAVDEDPQRLLVGVQIRREAALVADRRGQPTIVQQLLQRVEDLGADAHRLGEGGGAAGDDHELLEVDAVVGVGAAVEDVHHRNRQHAAPPARRGGATAAGRRRPPRRGRWPATRRGSRWRRGATCWASRRARSAPRRSPPGCRAG